MARLRQNFLSGLIEGGLSALDTTLTSAALQNALPVSTPDVMAIVLDPANSPEVVWITAHGATLTTATILRGQEGTTARAHAANVKWAHGPTAGDLVSQVLEQGEQRRRVQMPTPGSVLPYSKDPSDRMRVVVDNQPSVNTRYVAFGDINTSTPVLWYAHGAPNSMDQRQEQAIRSRLHYAQTRIERWRFT